MVSFSVHPAVVHKRAKEITPAENKRTRTSSSCRRRRSSASCLRRECRNCARTSFGLRRWRHLSTSVGFFFATGFVVATIVLAWNYWSPCGQLHGMGRYSCHHVKIAKRPLASPHAHAHIQSSSRRFCLMILWSRAHWRTRHATSNIISASSYSIAPAIWYAGRHVMSRGKETARPRELAKVNAERIVVFSLRVRLNTSSRQRTERAARSVLAWNSMMIISEKRSKRRQRERARMGTAGTRACRDGGPCGLRQRQSRNGDGVRDACVRLKCAHLTG
jgi:hypothetical protein